MALESILAAFSRGRIEKIMPALLAAAMVTMLALPSSAAARDRSDLYRIRLQIERELRDRPEMKQAKQHWVDTRLEYQQLRRRVVDALQRDSHYLSLRAEMWKHQDELDALAEEYRNGVVPRDRKLALATKILELGTQLSRIEKATLERHHDVMQARQAYLEAGRALLELRREIEEQVRNDPRFRSALERLNPGRGQTFTP